MTACPAPDALETFLGGPGDGPVAAHVQTCGWCQSALDGLTAAGPTPPPADPFAAEPELGRAVAALLAGRAGPPTPTGFPFLEPAAVPGDLGRVGPYRVVGVVAAGGMGVVFRAVDDRVRRTVAVKVMRPGRADPGAVARFLREGEAAAAVRHDNAVTLYEMGTLADGSPYLVMEYVPGGTLRDRVREAGPVPPRRAAEWVAQAADGVAAAHAAGLIHRDVKPSNVLVDAATGRAKVTDFGLARLAADGSHLTTRGDLLGTPAYMAPEQVAHPDRADPRSDVYGLGATLYEALTGAEPFRGSVPAVLEQVRTADPPPPRRLNEAVPPALDTVCRKAMAKEPGRRYPTPAALADDLRRWLRGEPVLARPVGRLGAAWLWGRRNPRVAGLLALAAVLFAGGFVGVGWQWRRADARYREARENYLSACEALRVWMGFGERVLRTKAGMSPAHRQRLREQRDQSEALLGRRADPAAEFAAAAVNWQLALHAAETGPAAEAEAAFGRALELFGAADRPDNQHARIYLANTHMYLGLFHLHATGRFDDALAHFGAGREVYAAEGRGQPDDPRWPRNVGVLTYLGGDAHLAAGRPAEALAAYDRARALLDPLARAYPDDIGYLLRRTAVDQRTGEALCAAGRPADALPLLAAARAARERANAADPDDIFLQRDLARTELFLATAHRLTGDPPAAHAAADRAAGRLDKLIADSPAVLDFRRLRGRVELERAALYRAAGDPARERECRARAAGSFRCVLAANPGDRSAADLVAAAGGPG